MSVADKITVRRRTRDAKLSLEDVVLVRGLWGEQKRLASELARVSTRAIAEKFGVSENTVLRAARGDIYVVED